MAVLAGIVSAFDDIIPIRRLEGSNHRFVAKLTVFAQIVCMTYTFSAFTMHRQV